VNNNFDLNFAKSKLHQKMRRQKKKIEKFALLLLSLREDAVDRSNDTTEMSQKKSRPSTSLL
jgi:hypothetical protein